MNKNSADKNWHPLTNCLIQITADNHDELRAFWMDELPETAKQQTFELPESGERYYGITSISGKLGFGFHSERMVSGFRVITIEEARKILSGYTVIKRPVPTDPEPGTNDGKK